MVLIQQTRPDLVIDAELLNRLADVYNSVSLAGIGHILPTVDTDCVTFTATLNDRPGFGPRAWEPKVRGTITNYDIVSDHAGMADPEPLAHIAGILSTHLGTGHE